MTDPTPTPANLLRAAAERAREAGDPLHTVAAGLLEVTAQSAAAASVDETARAALAVARQLLGTTTAEDTAAALEPQDHPGADLFAALQHAGLDVDEANRRMYAYARMVLRQEKAVAAPPAPADRAAEVEDLRAELDKLIRWHKEDGAQAIKAAATIKRLRAERAELNRRLDCLRGDMRDMESSLRERDAEFERIRRLADGAAAGVQPPTSEADTVLAAVIPAWEAVYEPGNVSDYLIGYANSEAAAKGAAIAWVLSQSDKTADRLGWEPQNWNDRHDAWFDLFERHDDGTETGVGVTVRHRLHPYTAADFTPEEPTR